MEFRTLSSTELIRNFLKFRPEIVEILESGFGNYSAVAESIRKEIELTTRTKIKTSAMSMALRRLFVARKGEKEKIKKIKPIEITTRTGIFEIAMKKDAKSVKAAESIRRLFLDKSQDFISVMEGTFEIVLYTNQLHKVSIKKSLPKKSITSEIDNLCCVTVNWPKETKEIPGIYARMTRALAINDISIQSFHTIGSEMTIYIKEPYLRGAHEILVGLLR